ncbi:MAG: tetratricopeptide repeat protein [Pseudomonadota bacterium]
MIKISKFVVVLFLLQVPSFLFGYEDVATSADIKNWRIQAENGDAEAQYDLAEAYRKGESVEQDEREAAKWYKESASQGYPDAQFAMGFVYRGGNGMPMDKVMSYMWFYLSVKNGDQRAIGLMNDLAWSMTESEIDEGRRKADEWKVAIQERKKKKKKNQSNN